MNSRMGVRMSWSIWKSLWVISLWNKTLQYGRWSKVSSADYWKSLWFRRVSKRIWLCREGIRVSASPWINNTGHLTRFIISKLLKCSWMKYERKRPATLAATSLIVVYGLIKTSALGLNILASILDGPLPIDLPNKITSSARKPRPPSFWEAVTCSKREMAHFFISFAFGVNFFFV